MKIIVAGVCCHDWTVEPKYPVKEPVPGRLECECDPPCKVFYINLDDEQASLDWTACTF